MCEPHLDQRLPELKQHSDGNAFRTITKPLSARATLQTWASLSRVRFAPIMLKKSAAQLFETAREDRRAWILACLGRHWGGERYQLGELSEVLDRCSEEELVLGPIWPS